LYIRVNSDEISIHHRKTNTIYFSFIIHFYQFPPLAMLPGPGSVPSMAASRSGALGTLPEVVKASLEWADVHTNQLHSYQRFFELLGRVIRKQAPEFLPAIAVLSKPFNAALRYERVLVTAERRLAEDLQDMVARYDVVLRLRDEFQTISKQLSDARTRIDRLRTEIEVDRRRGCQKQAKLTIDLAVARERKRKAVEDGKAKLREIIEYRQKYYVFYVRRLRHGYSYLGDVLAEASKRIAYACEVFRDLVAEIRENLDPIFAGTYDFNAEPEPIGDEEEDEEEPADAYAGEPYVPAPDDEKPPE
jgi:hypothetical protein